MGQKVCKARRKRQTMIRVLLTINQTCAALVSVTLSASYRWKVAKSAKIKLLEGRKGERNKRNDRKIVVNVHGFGKRSITIARN